MALKKTTLRSLLIMLGISLTPIYLWSSGGVQIAHILLFLGAAWVLWAKGPSMDQAGWIFSILVVYIAIRDSFNAIFDTSLDSVLPIFYAAFSWWIYISMRRWMLDDAAWKYAAWGLFLSGVIAVAGVVMMGYGATVDSEEGWRSIGTFNNPNQLGYFAVCMASLSCLFYVRGVLTLPRLLMLLAGALFLAVASLSKAAMIACGFCLLVAGFVASRSRAKFVVGCVVASILVSVSIFLVNAGALDNYKFFARLASIGSQRDDSMEGRGYGILTDAGAFEFLFGYGAQEVRRLVGHELHSTIASYFANYGVFGGILFVAVLGLWCRQVLKTYGVPGFLALVVPPMLYGLTHNGSRFTVFWLLLALSMVPAGQKTRGLAFRSTYSNSGRSSAMSG